MKKMLATWAAAAALLLAGTAGTALAAARIETLKDGSRIQIDGDKVYSPDAGKDDPESKLKDGDFRMKNGDFRMRKPAEDGSYTLKSGKVLVVKDGHLVDDKGPR